MQEKYSAFLNLLNRVFFWDFLHGKWFYHPGAVENI